MTDRDKLRAIIECFAEDWEEKPSSITVNGRIKLLFEADGTIRSIIKDGKSYRAGEGVRDE